MLNERVRSVFSSILSLSVAFTAGCGTNRRAENTGCRAAIVPGADIVIAIDIADLRASAIWQLIEARASGANEPVPTTKEKRLTEVTGLTRDDLIASLISADTEGIGLLSLSRPATLTNMHAVVSLALAKPLSHDQLVAALAIITEETVGIQIKTVTIKNKDVIVLSSVRPQDAPRYVATSRDHKTVYITFNESSIIRALNREAEGSYERIPGELRGLTKALPDNAQLRLMFVMPNSRSRQKSQTKGLTALSTLRSIAAGASFSDSIYVRLSAELASEQDASQAAAQITGILPMLAATILQNAGGSSVTPSLDAIKVGTAGTSCNMTLVMTEQDLFPTPAATQD